MARLEDPSRGATVRGLLATGLATITNVKWHGGDAVELTYKDASGQPHTRLLFRNSEPTLEVLTEGRPWSIDADGELLRLFSEAQHNRLALLCDPYLIIYTSQVVRLPHQISAVYYNHILPRQPLRFLLANDPSVGKTILKLKLVQTDWDLIVCDESHRF